MRPLLLIVMAGALSWAATAAAQDDDRAAADRLKFMLDSVRKYEVMTSTTPVKPLEFHEPHLLRWNNPVSGVPDGVIVMWRDGQRPAILAQVFQTKGGVWVQECQSVALSPFMMKDGARVLWSPTSPGGAFRVVPDAPAPADTALKRLSQMRDLARDFTGTDDFKIDQKDKETTRHELRLMSQPLYRYSDAAEHILDGAVFSFVLGTDPELFLILEARETATGGA